MVAMMIDHYKMDPELSQILEYFNWVFTGIFTIECILKLIGLGIYYFRIPWNLFDFIVVVLSLLGKTSLIMPRFLQSPGRGVIFQGFP